MRFCVFLAITLATWGQTINTVVNSTGNPDANVVIGGSDYFGNVLVGLPNGVFLLSPTGQMTPFPARSANQPSMQSILLGPDGALYGFTFSGFAKRSMDGTLTYYTKLLFNDMTTLDGQPIPSDRIWLRAAGPDGSMYLYNQINVTRLYRVRPGGKLEIVAGNGRRGRPVEGAALSSPLPMTTPSICVGQDGRVFLAYTNATDSVPTEFDFITKSPQVWVVEPNGQLRAFAGTARFGFSGDGGPARAADLYGASSCAVDTAGNVFISEGAGTTEQYGKRIRRVNRQGIISTVAGGASLGFSPNGTPAASSLLMNPSQLTVDREGNLYFYTEQQDRPEAFRYGYIRRIGFGSPTAVSGPSLAGITATASPIAPAARSTLQVARNSFVSLYGTQLASKQLDWSASIQGKQLPTSIDGVSVSIGGNPAAVHFVSGGQVNVLIPADQTLGSQMITLTASNGVQTYLPIQVVDVMPTLFALGADASRTGAIFDAVTYQSALPEGTIAGVASKAPEAGAFLVMYASGLGTTRPAAPPRESIPSALALAAPEGMKLNITKLGASTPVSLPVLYGGLVFAGVYQLNTQLPVSLEAGEYELTLSIGTVASPVKYRLTVRSSGN
jgi:uncharacterized protein (TIGR03437 family)